MFLRIQINTHSFDTSAIAKILLTARIYNKYILSFGHTYANTYGLLCVLVLMHSCKTPYFYIACTTV